MYYGKKREKSEDKTRFNEMKRSIE